MNKKLIIFGTRPEFIKLIPIIIELRKRQAESDFEFLFTGQHEDVVTDLFKTFEFTPDYSIPFKDQNNSLSHSFTHIFSAIQETIEKVLQKVRISIIIGQGDTTTCVCAAMCAFFNGIPFGHIESGLRTHDMNNPFPEELFRKIISLTSTVHFAPTIQAKKNLLKEGILTNQIILTGNTIVDAIEIIKSSTEKEIACSVIKTFNSRNNVLITCHRRENQNGKFKILLRTIKTIAGKNPLLNFIWISHNAPYIQNNLNAHIFEDQPNVHVLPPLSVFELFYLYEKTILIMTDSGGIQEEAPSFNIPVIVLRDHTERNESVDLQYAELIQINKEALVSAFNKLKNKPVTKMKNPYGSGNAATSIVSHLINNF